MPNLAHAIENLVDGAYFNSGQSCCGIQRIYVHERVYDAFVDGFVDLTRKYVLGNPLEPDDHARARSCARPPPTTIREQIAAIGARGRQARHRRIGISRRAAPARRTSRRRCCSTSITRCRSCSEEIFGPVAGIMKVTLGRGGDRAHERQRVRPDRRDLDRATRTPRSSIGDRIETGTWFMNRCDYLDPALAWVGVKDSGRGCTLSVVGYEHLTRPKSFHLRRDLRRSASHRHRSARRLMTTLRGNWNYPTAIRFGAGRIAELPDACKTLGMQAPAARHRSRRSRSCR